LDYAFEGTSMIDIYKRIVTIKKKVSWMDNIGFLKIDKTVTISMGIRNMDGIDSIIIEMKTS